MSGNRAATSEVGDLVRVRTDEGLEGWGEITPLRDLYLPTHWAEVCASLHALAPRLIGADPTNLSGVHRIMSSTHLGGGFGKTAIDVACWDLLGKAACLPVSVFLGGGLQDDFPSTRLFRCKPRVRWRPSSRSARTPASTVSSSSWATTPTMTSPERGRSSTSPIGTR